MWASALRADSLARVAPGDGWRNVIVFTALMTAAVALGHGLGNLQAQRRAGGLLPDSRTALAADVHPRARRAGDRARLAAQVLRRRPTRLPPRAIRTTGWYTSRSGRVAAASGASRPMRRSSSRWPCCRPRTSAGGGSRTDGHSLHPPDLLLTHLSGQTLPDGHSCGYGGRHRAGTGGL